MTLVLNSPFVNVIYTVTKPGFSADVCHPVWVSGFIRVLFWFLTGRPVKAEREPRAKSDRLVLRGEVGALPAPRGGANCVNPHA